MEEWKSITGFSNYIISNNGKIKSINYNKTGKSKELIPHKLSNGYLGVTLYDDTKKPHMLLIHRLVAITFIPNPNNYKIINHIDENRNNNFVDNLEWCDPKYNRQYGIGSKRMVETKKKNGSIQKIHQLTLDGEYIAEHETTKIASLKTGVNASAIYQCCRRFCKQMKGYVFLFDKDYKFLKNDDKSVDVELLRNNSAFRIKLSEKRGGLSYKEIKSPS